MRIVRIHMLIMVLLLCGMGLSGQDPSYVQYQVKDGLPSAEVYDVLCDSKGYIWAATDRGVSRYNGHEFQNFDTNDGLTNNTIFRIYEDYQGRIWFLGYDAQICYFQNEQFYPFPINDKITSLATHRYWWKEIVVHPNDSITLYEATEMPSILSGYCTIDSKWANISLQTVKSFEQYYAITSSLAFGRSDTLDQWTTRYKIAGREDRFGVLKKTKLNKESSLVRIPAFNYIDGQSSYLLNVKGKNIVNKFITKHIIHSYSILKKQIYLSTSNGLIILNSDDLSIDRTLYRKINMAKTIVDKEGNFWIATLDNGLYKVPNLTSTSLRLYSDGEEIREILAMETFDNSLILNTSTKRTVIINEQLEEKTLRSYQKFLPYSLYKFNDYMLLGGDAVLQKTSSGFVLDKFNGIVPNTNIQVLGDTLGIFASSGLIGEFKMDAKKKKIEYPIKYYFSSNETSIDLVLTEGRAGYTAMLTKLYYFDLTADIFRQIPFCDSLCPIRNSSLAYSKQDILFISTLGDGLYYLRNDTSYHLTTAQGLSSDQINRITLVNDSTLWLATNRGADQIQFSLAQDSLQIQSIKNFSTNEGLISDYITCIVPWNEKIVVGTDQGITVFNPDHIQTSTNPPHLVIDQMEVNGESVAMDSSITFQHFQQNIAFQYTANSMRKLIGLDRYHYRLLIDDKDSDWSTTDIREIQFSNLNPGDYTFEIMASNSNGTKFSAPRRIDFCIEPHFTATAWFKGLLILGGALSIYLLFQFRINRLKRKAELEKIEQRHLLEVNNAQLAALRSQMNPHFIFNSLNSIQNFIFKNDVRAANHFLTKFSRLIRESLVLSKLESVTLTKELDFLKDYLELEQMRFPGIFNFKISIDKNIDIEEVLIPPLLIQPLLENAIRHGFKGITHKGLLTIKIEQKENSIVISITDNGVGMAQAQKAKKMNGKHVSFATNILTNRIQLINEKSSGEKATFEITELVGHQGKSEGVSAKIVLPQTPF